MFCHLKCLNIDDAVDVNPSLRTRLRVKIVKSNINTNANEEKGKEMETIWYPARIRKIDKHSGQVQVTYKVGKKKLHYWTHLDNGNEIAAFGTKYIQQKRIKPQSRNEHNDSVNYGDCKSVKGKKQ